MHELAGIIVTPKTTNIDKRMRKFCDFNHERKPDAFCDGWAPVYIDKNGNLHTKNDFDEDLQIYCEELRNYRVRNVVNPYYGGFPFSGDQFYPAGLSVLITPSDKAYFEEDVEAKVQEYCAKHPDWWIYIINYHC